MAHHNKLGHKNSNAPKAYKLELNGANPSLSIISLLAQIIQHILQMRNVRQHKKSWLSDTKSFPFFKAEL